MTALTGRLTAVRAIERQRGRRGLGADQRVDDDDSGVALDEADIRQVQAADLIDALDHFVEALLGDQRALPPQARMHGGRCVAGQERVDVVVPDHPAVGGLDHTRFQRRDEAAVGGLEIGGVT